MYAYCLFCETVRCAAIARFIQTTTGMRCISPQIIQRKWIKGVPTEEAHSWLPGYIFLYSEEPLTPVLYTDGIIRWLYSSNDQYALLDQDYAFAMMLYRQDGVIGTVPLAEVGDRVHLADSLWAGMDGKIVKFDRGRKRCCVEFTFNGVVHDVWVSCEIIRTDREEV